MDLVGSDLEAVAAAGGSGKRAGGGAAGGSPPPPAPALLQPRQQSSLYQITVAFDNEQSCGLAIQFVEVKRYV